MTDTTQTNPAADEDLPDLPVLADEGDEYDPLQDMDEDERAWAKSGILSDEELAALSEGDEEGDAETDEPEAPPAANEQQNATQTDAAATPPADDLPATLTEEQIAKIDEDFAAAQKSALDEWRDGMLTDAELEAKLADARKAARDAERAAIEAIRDAQAEAAWNRRVQAFQAEAQTFLNDNPHLKGEREIKRFDQIVRQVTGDPDLVALTDREKLELAAERYEADARRLKLALPAGKPKPKAEAKAEAPPAQKPESPLRQAVPTLANVPVAAANSATDGKWSALQAQFDELEGNPHAQERFLERLTDEEREAFSSMDV